MIEPSRCQSTGFYLHFKQEGLLSCLASMASTRPPCLNCTAHSLPPQSLGGGAGAEAQFAAADGDGDGLLNFAEFSDAYLAQPLSLPRQALRAELGLEAEREC